MTSLWQEIGPGSTRNALSGDTEADVVIAGGGYSGLWTALHLIRRDPSLRVVVVEASQVGFGASGRNGGWFSSKVAGMSGLLADPETRPSATLLQRAMIDLVPATEAFLAGEGIDCDWQRGGTVDAATTPAQEREITSMLHLFAEAGFGDDYRWLSANEMADHFRPVDLRGGYWTPHTAAMHPLKLARGLADAAERRGVRIVERTRVEAIGPGVARTDHGVIRAPVIINALEAYGVSLPGGRRRLAPIYSLMIATQPLPADVWDEIGLANRETFSDGRRLIIYGQRTADDRIAFGGRGAPYHFGSAIRRGQDTDAAVAGMLAETLTTSFPVLQNRLEVSHHWGGPLGVPRDWRPSVNFDPVTGLGSLGGYVGQGVAAAALAADSLSALVVGEAGDPVAGLPWVGHRSPRWEPEPLRWLGVNAGLALTKWTDASELRTGRPARLRGAIIHRLIGL